MTKVSASDAKTHFGALLDKARREPVTIEKQGRPVAVVISFESYLDQQKAAATDKEKQDAIRFLKKWSKRPVAEDPDAAVGSDPRARAIWDKYTRIG